ncbi:ABC transporter ATP-binding protein [Sulfurimonas sp.]
MEIKKKIFQKLSIIISEDKKNIFYLLYYSAIEAVLVLSIPLASAFIINSILAHSSLSIFVLGFIVVVIFLLTTILQVVKEYIIEKFQQKFFVKTAIEISQMAINLQKNPEGKKESIDKIMNYFFDVTSIQKIFPILILEGSGLIIKIIVSLILLLAFSPVLFSFGLTLFMIFIVILLLLGKNGMKSAITRSDTKHTSIYYLQHIPYKQNPPQQILQELDRHLQNYVSAREKMFAIIIRQLTLSFLMEGIIFSLFLIVGGYLVVEGKLPIGEFVAAEIIVVSISYAIKGFVKQIDYVYDIVEGLYKVDKLSLALAKKTNG